jgi:arsenate reductase
MTRQSAPVTIYHNPACSTSRDVLQRIRATGVEPTVIEYLIRPPDRQTLLDLLGRMRARPRDILRQKGTPYAALDLDAPHWSDAQLIDFMVQYPLLINRPIVATPWGAKLCRPAESVRELLPPAQC